MSGFKPKSQVLISQTTDIPFFRREIYKDEYGYTCFLYLFKKYNREGSLIQGNYKAISILDKRQLTTTGIYIHVNPLQAGLVSKLKNYPYSSYKYYWGEKKAKWLVVNIDIKKATDYKNFSTYLKDKNITDYESSIF